MDGSEGGWPDQRQIDRTPDVAPQAIATGKPPARSVEVTRCAGPRGSRPESSEPRRPAVGRGCTTALARPRGDEALGAEPRPRAPASLAGGYYGGAGPMIQRGRSSSATRPSNARIDFAQRTPFEKPGRNRLLCVGMADRLLSAVNREKLSCRMSRNSNWKLICS
jgi:hypothetical protein